MLLLLANASPPCETPVELRHLLEWWEVKAGQGLPDRRRIDPVEIDRHLANVALLYIEGEDFRFRLVGERLRMRYGAVKGRNLADLLSGRGRSEILGEHRTCTAERRPTLMRRGAPTCDGTDVRRYWRLLLPFGEGGVPVALLAAMRFDS